MKKLLSLVLCLMLALSVMSGMTASAENENPLWIGDYDLTWWVPIDSYSAQAYESYAEHPFFIWMEEQTGVHVEFIHYTSEQASQQFNMMLAAQDLYDMLYDGGYPDGPQAGIDDGIYADINDFRDLMPNYFAAIECGDGSFSDWLWGPEAALYRNEPQPAFLPLMTTVHGNVFAVTQSWTDDLGIECGFVIRQDWLDQLGLEVPTTIDELETVLAAFKTLGDDVIPMALGSDGFNYYGYLQNAFDINYSWYYVVDDVVQAGSACGTQGLYDYLALMSDWFAKGYIDPDFVSRDDAGKESLLLTDRLGMLDYAWGGPESYEYLYEGEQDFNLTAIPFVRKTNDQQLHWNAGYESSCCCETEIYAKSENKEIAAQWLDKLWAKEVILRGQYGVEGVDYILVDGVPYFTEENRQAVEENEGYLMLNLYPNLTGYWDTRSNMLHPYYTDFYNEDGTLIQPMVDNNDYLSACKIWGEYSDRDNVIGFVSFDGDGWDEMVTPYNDASTTFSAYVLRVIMGEASLDDYEAMCHTCWDLGFAESRELCQASYNAQHGLPEDYGMDYVMEIDR